MRPIQFLDSKEAYMRFCQIVQVIRLHRASMARALAGLIYQN